MSLKNTPKTFGLISRANHWITALLFITAILVAIIAEEFIPKGDARTAAFQFHFSLGVTIFALFLFRIIWLKISPNPTPIGDNRKEQIIAASVKGLLYLSMLFLPILGYIMVSLKGIDIHVFGLFTLPNIFETDPESTLKELSENLHVFGGFAIIAVLALHIAGAMKHHFILKDNTLLRMLGKMPSKD